MSKFATSKRAYGISDRSGFRYRLKDMRKEWNGLLVGPDEYEEKHPQLEPIRRRVDREAVRDPRPQEKLDFEVSVGGGGFPDRGKDIVGVTSIGRVSVTT